MSRTLQVRAPCRLHFGMFGFGHGDRPQFGGVGTMIEPPGVEVTLMAAERFTARGDLSNRVRQFVESAVARWHWEMPRCEIRVNGPPDHVGLGVGTQLGLAVVAGLRQFLRLPELAIEELAASVGRGYRSAVGTYGFQSGGLIVDGGKLHGEPMGKLVRRLAVPDAWRFVLARFAKARGLAGHRERDAFARLPVVPPEVTARLWSIAEDEIVPAVERADCGRFGEAVYRFGRLAGECFEPIQGGPYANQATAELVSAIRGLGIPGVGQSSWGPTVFAIAPGEAEADELAERLRDRYRRQSLNVAVSRANNSGAHFNTDA